MIHYPNKGFTLVETLVAITVLMIAIVGPLYAVHKSVAASYAARDTMIATALAQEGVEYVRYVRDGNYLETNPDWLDGLSACRVNGASDYGCAVDAYLRTIQACPSSGCPVLNNDAVGRYTYAAGTATRFSRAVTIKTISETEVRVTVTVSWITLKTPYTVRVSEELYKWQ